MPFGDAPSRYSINFTREEPLVHFGLCVITHVMDHVVHVGNLRLVSDAGGDEREAQLSVEGAVLRVLVEQQVEALHGVQSPVRVCHEAHLQVGGGARLRDDAHGDFRLVFQVEHVVDVAVHQGPISLETLKGFQLLITYLLTDRNYSP